MTLTLNVLGIELARIVLDIERDDPKDVTVIDKVQKATSRWFFKGMVK